MVTFKQLRYALAVRDTRHFKRAADQCSVSQAALSTAVGELENQLGVKIFERDNRQVLVTRVGEEVLTQAALVRTAVDDLLHVAASGKSPLTGALSVGVIPTIGPFLLPAVLPAVRERYPQLRMKITEEQSANLVEKVRKGDLDTAIIALPYALNGLHSFEFAPENFVVIAHRDHPLAQHSAVAPAQLPADELLLLADGNCLKDQALGVCQLTADESNEAVSGTSLYTLVQMVAGKMGITLIPEMALPLVSANDELASIALNAPGPHRRLAFIARLNYPGVANIENLIQLMREQLQNCR